MTFKEMVDSVGFWYFFFVVWTGCATIVALYRTMRYEDEEASKLFSKSILHGLYFGLPLTIIIKIYLLGPLAWLIIGFLLFKILGFGGAAGGASLFGNSNSSSSSSDSYNDHVSRKETYYVQTGNSNNSSGWNSKFLAGSQASAIQAADNYRASTGKPARVVDSKGNVQYIA